MKLKLSCQLVDTMSKLIYNKKINLIFNLILKVCRMFNIGFEVLF